MPIVATQDLKATTHGTTFQFDTADHKVGCDKRGRPVEDTGSVLLTLPLPLIPYTCFVDSFPFYLQIAS